MHISPDDKRLQYCGRIDFDNPKAPVLVYAASFVQIRFTGTEIAVTLENKRAYWSNRMGYIYWTVSRDSSYSPRIRRQKHM